jgi:hypothetical protein
MDQQILCVGFDGYQVAVHSDASEVVAELKHSFHEMLKLESPKVAGRLEVQRRDGKYHVAWITQGRIEAGPLANTVECLRYEVILRLIQARHDLLWLHAGAAAYRDSAVMISGSWGRGKSTLITNLCANGWMYLSDEIVPLNPNSGRGYPFPLTPAVRENLGQEISSDRLLNLRKTIVHLKPETVCRESMPIGCVVLPVYGHRCRTELLPCSPATAALELLQSCLNFPRHREAAVRYVCDLVKTLPAFHLKYSDGKRGADLIAAHLA